MDLLANFDRRSHLYCFSQMPALLFGQTASTTINEKIHDLIKKEIPLEKTYHHVLLKLTQITENILSKCDEYRI
jgi:hypothetical protein